MHEGRSANAKNVGELESLKSASMGIVWVKMHRKGSSERVGVRYARTTEAGICQRHDEVSADAGTTKESSVLELVVLLPFEEQNVLQVELVAIFAVLTHM